MPHSLKAQRRPTLLIVGCGDVGLRVLKLLAGRWTVWALTSSPERMPALRAAGAMPLLGNLDDPTTLGRLGGLADRVLHLAPPPGTGRTDPRTAHLLRALARGGRTARLVYGSTTGVYGDCGGDWVDETRAVNPSTDRARRRVDAEARLRHFGRHSGCQVTILRIPGIYALDREGGDPRERVRRGTPALLPADDVYTNHIHADDLARACVRALTCGRPQRAINVCDDSDLRMGDYFDLVAQLWNLPRPPRVSRAQALATLPPMMMSFMSESRRLRNARLKGELGLVLRYPTVNEGLAGAALEPDPDLPVAPSL
jgi:nucleoside-diphosphate-sugar epimerase